MEGLRGGLCDGTRLLSTTTAGDLDTVGAASAPGPGTLAVDLPLVDPTFSDMATEPIIWGPAAVAMTAVVVAVALLRRRHRA